MVWQSVGRKAEGQAKGRRANGLRRKTLAKECGSASLALPWYWSMILNERRRMGLLDPHYNVSFNHPVNMVNLLMRLLVVVQTTKAAKGTKRWQED